MGGEGACPVGCRRPASPLYPHTPPCLPPHTPHPPPPPSPEARQHVAKHLQRVLVRVHKLDAGFPHRHAGLQRWAGGWWVDRVGEWRPRLSLSHACPRTPPTPTHIPSTCVAPGLSTRNTLPATPPCAGRGGFGSGSGGAGGARPPAPPPSARSSRGRTAPGSKSPTTASTEASGRSHSPSQARTSAGVMDRI